MGALGAAQEALRRQLEVQEKLHALQGQAFQQRQALTLQQQDSSRKVYIRPYSLQPGYD